MAPLTEDQIAIWEPRQPSFTPGGTTEYENRVWETREYRIGCGWPVIDADNAYQAEMSGEGYEREAEID